MWTHLLPAFCDGQGYIFVVSMRSKADVLQAVKQFAKELGAPDAIVCDAAREQMLSDLKKFLTSIGVEILRCLENCELTELGFYLL